MQQQKQPMQCNDPKDASSRRKKLSSTHKKKNNQCLQCIEKKKRQIFGSSSCFNRHSLNVINFMHKQTLNVDIDIEHKPSLCVFSLQSSLHTSHLHLITTLSRALCDCNSDSDDVEAFCPYNNNGNDELLKKMKKQTCE